MYNDSYHGFSAQRKHMQNTYEPEFFRLPFPPDFSDEPDTDVLSRANAMCGAAEKILELATGSGQEIEISEDDRIDSRRIFDAPSSLPAVQKTAVAIHLTALLNEFDVEVVQSANQLRNFCTNLLIDKAVNGKTEQVQLRAVEMIGKMANVALFSEVSTIRIESLGMDELKAKLRDKINNMRYKMTDVTTVEPAEEEANENP